MEKIVIGRKNIKERKFYTTKQKMLFGLCVIALLLFLYFTQVGILVLFLGICLCFGGMWVIFSNINKGLEINVYHPNITIEIDQNNVKYSNQKNNQSFCLEIKEIGSVRLNYIQRYISTRPVVDLRLEFLMKDDSLYLLSTRGILSQKGDYLKVIEFLEKVGIQVYDPHQLRSILDKDSYDFQFALLNRK